MNAPVSPLAEQETTRHPFTGEDVLRLIRDGLITEDRVELLRGDIVIMAAEGKRHVNLKAALNALLVTRLQGSAAVACDSTLYLSDNNWPSPDFYLVDSAMLPADAGGRDTLLVIELADTTVNKDMELKGALYREHGVREYWVIDIERRVTHIHTQGAWPAARPIPFDRVLTPMLLPSLQVRLSDLAPA